MWAYAITAFTVKMFTSTDCVKLNISVKVLMSTE